MSGGSATTSDFGPSIERSRRTWSDGFRSAPLQGLPDPELFDRAEDLLRSWKVVLPAPSTLERIVASITARVRHEVFERIAERLTPGFRQAIDDLLQVPEGEQRSRLFRLKEYPSGANITSAKN